MSDNLCAEAGYVSLNKAGEALCGDHVEVVNDSRGLVLVLADGLGSGVKAAILSTLTAKILGTMVAGGMPLDECVDTVVRTLPVCRERGIAYSTFSVIHLDQSREVRLIQFDNPEIIALRDGAVWDYPSVRREIAGRSILESRFEAREGDRLLALSDGATYAGAGRERNYGWQRENIARFAVGLAPGLSAKACATAIADACMSLYGGQPGDDATVAAVRLRARRAVSVAFGPPASRDEDRAMMHLLFGKQGAKIVCGGTTAAIAARYLRAPVRTTGASPDPDVPPIGQIDGVDLVTEGMLTVTRALSYLERSLSGGEIAPDWYGRNDGASLLARALMDEATDVNFLVGRAVNPANGGAAPDIKARLIHSMADCLAKMGKRVKVSFF